MKTNHVAAHGAKVDLRRYDFLSVNKLGVGNGFAVAFEHHDRLLGVAEVVVMDTVICKEKQPGYVPESHTVTNHVIASRKSDPDRGP